jgi:hypothetical protein
MPSFEYGMRELGLTKKECHPWSDKNFKGDKRLKEWHKEQAKYGFDEREMWSLDLTFAVYIYPRLKYFRDAVVVGIFHDDEMKKDVDKMLWSFAEIVKQNHYANGDKEYNRKLQEGLRLFAKRYFALWF